MRTCPLPARIALAVAMASLLALSAIGAETFTSSIEADWLRQAQAWQPGVEPTQGDAAGAVDGVKNGLYAFHTGQEPNPWWQVDLGTTQAIARVIVFNRLDYAPGLHNADNLLILASEDGKQWRTIHHNDNRHFGGISGAPPLQVDFAPGELSARFIRLQIPSQNPIVFHLDEVEIYAPDNPQLNVALRRPADQSSVSQWSASKIARPAGAAAVRPAAIRHFIQSGRALASELGKSGVKTANCERDLATAEQTLESLSVEHSGKPIPAGTLQELYFKVRWAIRRLALANPLLHCEELLFVKRFTQETYPDVCLNHMPWVSRPGGDICVLTRPFSPDGAGQKVRGLLNGALGPGHVHGMDLKWNADRVVFGYARAKSSQPPEGWLDRMQSFRLRRSEEPIHLYEMSARGRNLRQITRGEWSDLDPTYLPNGDIVFVSERCGTSLQCNEYDKDETSCNLYVTKPDGSGIRRLSTNKDGDYLPHTLDDGTVGYTRWEYHERSWAYIQSIWTVRPDGTQADAIFKQHFTNPWSLEDTRSIPGTQNRLLVSVAAGHHTLAAGPVVLVTPGLGLNDPQGLRIVTPGVLPPEGGMAGAIVTEGGVCDDGGHYMNPWPISDKTFLVSYAYGTGKSGVASEVDPAGYALYLIDVFGNKELIYRDPAISCSMPIPLRPRPRPPVLPDLIVPGADYATCMVSTVSYGCEGLAPERIRYLRIAEPIGWPYDNQHGGQRYGEDHRYGGPGAEQKNLLSWTPIRILGDVPVERDGSAVFRVPVDTAVYFQILDENRMELRRMRSFISFQPGEQRACTGCHESRTVAPVPAQHVNSLAMRRDPAPLIPPPWGDRPINFLLDVQPVLDRHCVSCHGGIKPAGGIDLCGGLTSHDEEVRGYGQNRAYDTIIEKQLVSISAVRAQDASITPPLAYGSHKSKLINCLTNADHLDKVALTPDDRLRLVMWIDANAPYHDRFVNKRPDAPAYDLAQDKGLLSNLTRLHERRCVACHKAEAVTRLDWIDLQQPAQSLFISAPLAKNAGGSDKCGGATYKDRTDPDFLVALDLVDAAVRKAWKNPRRDLESQAVPQGIQSAAK